MYCAKVTFVLDYATVSTTVYANDEHDETEATDIATAFLLREYGWNVKTLAKDIFVETVI